VHGVKDDPGQAAIAARLVAEAVDDDVSIYINVIVLCEAVWVLESGYEYPKAVVADALEKLLLTQQFELEARDQVWRGLRRYRVGKGDFADYLIGERNLADGCARTSTFDRALRNEEGFEVLA
jgi:predicted nucleic-acid-binding protein